MTVTCNYRSTAVIILPGVYLPPQRNATVADDAFSLLFISIHAPREGSDDLVNSLLGTTIRISIHAPREGSDAIFTAAVVLLVDFNPRSPRGERPKTSDTTGIATIFQSTLPARGATGCPCPLLRSSSISIHAPREGSDRIIFARCRWKQGFQSTLPARGATPHVMAVGSLV